MVRPFGYLLVCNVLIFSSCVPNKRIVYLQRDKEPKRGAVSNTDTSFYRNYTTYFSDYVFKPRDIISLNIASITPQEFDFVKSYEEQLGLIRKLTQYEQATPGGGAARGGGNMGSGGTGMSPIVLDRMQTGFTLDEEGYLELPYIGKLKFAGLTIPQCETLVREKLKGYFETPVVRIQLLSFHFTILGEVKKEGRYTAYDPNATVIDAIAMAENLNDYADRSKIKIIRTEGHQTKVYYVNALKEDLLEQPGYYMKPNDIIIVPPLKARYAGKYVVPNSSFGLGLLTATLSLAALVISLIK